MSKYYLIAGEASGDLHASNLMKEMVKLDPNASFRGFGGDLMQQQGAKIVRHISQLDFMGFLEILLHLRSILALLRDCRKDVLEWKPDAIILIDYPGFNLRMAEFAHREGIPVFYYISPQLWAWKQGRIAKIRRYVNRLFVILPFEKDFYARVRFDVDYVGHPLLDAMPESVNFDQEAFRLSHHLEEKPLIALLPGSRKQEIRRILPEMLAVIPLFSDEYQFVIAAAGAVPPEFFKKLTRGHKVTFLYGNTYPLLKACKAALITSGTATLEAALLEVPQVVCYKGNIISLAIARKLVKLKYISLVNLIMDREVVKELIQEDLNKKALHHHLEEILFSDKKKEQIQDDYVELRQKLGGKGASKTTATLILKYLDN